MWRGKDALYQGGNFNGVDAFNTCPMAYKDGGIAHFFHRGDLGFDCDVSELVARFAFKTCEFAVPVNNGLHAGTGAGFMRAVDDDGFTRFEACIDAL